MYDSHVIIICHIIYGAFFFYSFFYIKQSHYGSVLHIWQSQFCVFHICHIPTVWYVVFFIFVIFRQCGMLCFSYLSYSDSVVCCGFHICHIPTVWYVVFFIFVIFRQCGMLCFTFYIYKPRVFSYITVKLLWFLLFISNSYFNALYQFLKVTL